MRTRLVVIAILATAGSAVSAAEVAPSADLAQMEAQLAKLRLVYSDQHPDVIALLEKIKAEREAEGLDPPPAPQKSDADDLKSARARLQELRVHYTDRHPDVIAQKKRVEELERQQNPGGQ